VSTFACDDFMVFSDATFPNTSSALKAVKIEVLEGPLTSPRGGDTNSYLNAPTFAKAWHRIFVDARFNTFDWVVKVDVDAVLFPERLRYVLSSACQEDPCEAVALNICGNWWGSATSMVPGPIQAVSRAAVQRMAAGVERCHALGTARSEEDIYLSRCLDLLSVRRASPKVLPVMNLECGSGVAAARFWKLYDAVKVLEDSLIAVIFVCDCCHAAYHPFKTQEMWSLCHYWAHDAYLHGWQRVCLILVAIGVLVNICVWLCVRNKARKANFDSYEIVEGTAAME